MTSRREEKNEEGEGRRKESKKEGGRRRMGKSERDSREV